VQEFAERSLVHPVEERGERPADQQGALTSQEAGAGEVGLDDRPAGVEADEAGRREIVELEVAVLQRFRLLPRIDQLIVLHLQFDLVDLQFVDEPLQFRR